jgi:outer membrane protein OmpA-like peptidoglycan-associated protein
MPRRFTFGLCLAVLGSLSLPAGAQTADEVNRIIGGLAPIPGQTVVVPPVLIQPAPRTNICVDTRYTIDFELYFNFDSADLTPRARQELAALGRALASQELQPYSYMVAGHTDGTGQPAYNQTLSERRAAAVVRYLVEAFPISPDRLIAVGFGQSRLKVPANPRAAINRRVEVLMIVPC